MSKPRNGLIAALDLGTTKVCCFVARTDGNAWPRVIGIGHQVSKGVRSGTIVDMEAAQSSILNTVHAAEQMAEETIHEILVNISSGHPTSRTLGVEITVNGHEIGDSDVRRLLEQAIPGDEPPERDLIHAIPVGFALDGGRGIRDPRGMYGERLGVDIHRITAGSGAVRNLTTCVARCHLDIGALVVSPYASGLAALVEDEMDLGVTLIDMGGGTTTIAVFFDGEVVHTDSVPLGGSHVTNDIARGLSTPLVHAERMKALYGSAIASPSDEHEIIDVPQIGEEPHTQANHVPKSILVGVIRPRIEETFELVRSRLEDSGFDKLTGHRVVLTGGASQLQGVDELAALILDKQVRMGRPKRIDGLAEAACGPAFSTCAGLLTHAAQKHVQPPGWGHDAEPSGAFDRLHQWLRENF